MASDIDHESARHDAGHSELPPPIAERRTLSPIVWVSLAIAWVVAGYVLGFASLGEWTFFTLVAVLAAWLTRGETGGGTRRS
jgi:hypothetical protein